MPNVRLLRICFHRLPMNTRIPFRYGIATMTEAPYLFVSATAEIEGRVASGLSADGLPPKWFTKNPSTTFEEDDLPAMLRVIRHAADVGVEVGRRPSFFQWWRRLYDQQLAWAREHGVPPLLAGFGASLIERAMLDALCRSLGVPFFLAVQKNLLGIDFAELRPSLGSIQPRDVLPSQPRSRVHLRHTVGLGDPLDTVANADRPNDGLPLTLTENIEAYGLRYFKIKLSGDIETDRDRLIHIAAVLEHAADHHGHPRFTLDGNENFQTIAEFREAWHAFSTSTRLKNFFDQSLMFVEQPIHRSTALSQSVSEQLRAWPDAPPIIIDESDAELESLPAALSLGYSGTSHKNCKGIVKGLLAAATIAISQTQPTPLILSAEDLGNVGPIALLQDLAVVSALGISHVERNGHHYFAGLSMFPDAVNRAMLEGHADLYQRHGDNFAAVAVHDGMLTLDSVNAAPFGLHPQIEMEPFEVWEF